MQTTTEKHSREPLAHHLNSHPRLRREHILPLLTRLLVWGIIFGVLAFLSSFFTLIFLTFVFAHLQSGMVDALARHLPQRRTALVVLIGSLFLAIVIAMSLFLAPNAYQRAAGFAKGFSVYMERIDRELLNLAEHYPILQEAIPELKQPVPPEQAVGQMGPAVQQRAFRDSPTGLLLGGVHGDRELGGWAGSTQGGA